MDDIPLKTSSSETFVDIIPSPKPSSPPLVKIAEIDISKVFSAENLILDDIDSLTALKMLDCLIDRLIKTEEIGEHIGTFDDDSNENLTTVTSNSSKEEDIIPCEDTPFSPKKNRYRETNSNYVLLETNNNDNKADKTHKPLKSQESKLIKRFVLKDLPDLTHTEYLERINRYCCLSTAVYLTCLHYLYKLVIEWDVVKLTKYNVHRLIIAGLRVSCKTLEDINHRQQFIAKIGGVKLDDLKFLEISFLFLMNFDCQSNANILNNTIGNFREVFKAEFT